MMAKREHIERDSASYLQGTSGVFVMLGGDTALNFQFDDQLTLRLVDESDERSKNLAMLAMLEDAIDEARRVIA